MDYTYKSPGSYVEEKQGQILTILGIPTGMCAMVATLPWGPVGEVVDLADENDFNRKLGGVDLAYPATQQIDQYFKNARGNGMLKVLRTCHYTDIADPTTKTAVASSVTLKDRAGTPLATLKVTAKYEGTRGQNIKLDITDGSELPGSEFNIAVKYNGTLVETWSNLSMDATKDNYVEKKINDELAGSLWIVVDDQDSVTVAPNDRPANETARQLGVAGTPALTFTAGDDGLTSLDIDDFLGDEGAGTGFFALQSIYEMLTVAIPEVESHGSWTNADKAAFMNDIMTACAANAFRFFICSVPDNIDVANAITFVKTTGNFDSSFGAIYHDWVQRSTDNTWLSPSGSILGIYSYNDALYGVKKAPAGVEMKLAGIKNTRYKLTDTQGGLLNGNRINAIRTFSGLGTVVWGSRTLSSDVIRWRYISTRRNMMFVSLSIKKGTFWATHSVNDTPTWDSIQNQTRNFLMSHWMAGGLRGDTPAAAFYNRCDSTTNTPQTIAEGKIIQKVGCKFPKVGEFIVTEIEQIQE